MQTRRLGRTGHMSTVVIFGTAAFWEIDQAGAEAALDLAVEYGVNHIDVAPQYGQAQERLGPWLESRRNDFFLNCKTLERTRDGAWADLGTSLKLLRTDRLDLHQLHAINDQAELDKVFSPDGAIETLVEARAQGITRYLGITGHGLQAPATSIEALNRFEFDTVMFPINPQLYADTQYRADAERLLALCAGRDVGVQIIKSVARGPWGEREKRYHTWYEPHDTPDEIEAGVRFALSQAGVTAVVSAGDTRLLRMTLESGANFRPMDEDEQAAALARATEVAPLFV